jgi:DnaJ-class molecular chaperone
MYDEKTNAKVNTTKDYYYILGVRPDATTEEIEEAYQELNEKFGPHINMSGQDPELIIKTYKEISDAFEVLTDPAKRRDYDKASVGKRSSASELRNLLVRRPVPQAPVSSSTTASNLTAQSPPPSQDPDRSPKMQALALEMEVDVSLREAIKGCRREFAISDPRTCDDCQGRKSTGKVLCQSCRGMGYYKVERIVVVDLPAGMYEGGEVVLAEKGRYDLRAARNGDLIIRTKLKPHPVLSVLGRDITCTIPVSIYEAILGAEIEAPTATGKVVLKIQPLTQPGRVYRLKGMGLAGADQLVTIEVLIPQSVTGEEVQLFRKLKELSREPNPRDALLKHSQSS